MAINFDPRNKNFDQTLDNIDDLVHGVATGAVTLQDLETVEGKVIEELNADIRERDRWQQQVGGGLFGWGANADAKAKAESYDMEAKADDTLLSLVRVAKEVVTARSGQTDTRHSGKTLSHWQQLKQTAQNGTPEQLAGMLKALRTELAKELPWTQNMGSHVNDKLGGYVGLFAGGGAQKRALGDRVRKVQDTFKPLREEAAKEDQLFKDGCALLQDKIKARLSQTNSEFRAAANQIGPVTTACDKFNALSESVSQASRYLNQAQEAFNMLRDASIPRQPGVTDDDLKETVEKKLKDAFDILSRTVDDRLDDYEDSIHAAGLNNLHAPHYRADSDDFFVNSSDWQNAAIMQDKISDAKEDLRELVNTLQGQGDDLRSALSQINGVMERLVKAEFDRLMR